MDLSFKPEYEDNILFDLFNSHDIGSYKLDMSEEELDKKLQSIEDEANRVLAAQNKEVDANEDSEK